MTIAYIKDKLRYLDPDVIYDVTIRGKTKAVLGNELYLFHLHEIEDIMISHVDFNTKKIHERITIKNHDGSPFAEIFKHQHYDVILFDKTQLCLAGRLLQDLRGEMIKNISMVTGDTFQISHANIEITSPDIFYLDRNYFVPTLRSCYLGSELISLITRSERKLQILPIELFPMASSL